MKIKTLTIALILSFISFYLQPAGAHIAYKDLLQSELQTINPDGSKTFTTLGSVTSNGAWADATDDTWGNTHRTPWYKFDITNPNGAYVDLALARETNIPGLDVLGDLNPAFSLYKGLLPHLGHDGLTEIPGKDGMWQAWADTTLANDDGDIATIQYLMHAGIVDGQLSAVSLLNIFLGPGSYSVALGGSCYECYPHYDRFDPASPNYDPNYENIIIDIENDAGMGRGYKLDLTIQPVPLPAALWLMMFPTLCLLRFRHKPECAKE